MKKSYFFFFLLFFSTVMSWAQAIEETGLKTTYSAHSVKKTVELLKTAIEEMGLNIIAEVDHSKAAGKNGLELRPTYLLIFGNPEVGTKLMQADQRTGLDLPMRLLIYEEDEGKVLISYHDPEKLQLAYQLEGQKKTIEKMQGALRKLVQKVSK